MHPGLDSCFDISIEIALHHFDTAFNLCTVKGGAYLHPGLDSCFDISIEISLHRFDTVFKLSSSDYVTLRHLCIFIFLILISIVILISICSNILLVLHTFTIISCYFACIQKLPSYNVTVF